MTTSTNFNSLLGRLQHTTGLELSDCIREILGYPEALDQVVQIIESKIDEGINILDEPLVSLVSKARSAHLYEKVRERLFKNTWSLLTLYKSKYPDPEIEKLLCKRLFALRSNDADPQRGYIVRAMKEVASDLVLPTLEAILFELEPSTKVRKTFSDALGPIGALEVHSRTEFMKCIALAINEIQSRAAKSSDIAASSIKSDEPEEQIHRSNNASRYRETAQNLLGIDLESALSNLRKAAEALAKDLYRHLDGEKNGKPAKKMTLQDLLKFVDESSVPDVLKHAFRTLQCFGNFASHDQDDQSTHLTKPMVSSLFQMYDEAAAIYLDWLKRNK